jgi:hypothetical protein
MYTAKADTFVRIPVERWRYTRFIVPVRETRRHRSLAAPVLRQPKRARRGSFTETDTRAS